MFGVVYISPCSFSAIVISFVIVPLVSSCLSSLPFRSLSTFSHGAQASVSIEAYAR